MTSRPGPGTMIAWAALLLTFAAVAGVVAANDFRDRPSFGDSTSFVMQAVSLAGPDHDLVYGPADAADFRAMGWGEPIGLLMQQRGDEWTAAKPLGYSALLSIAWAHLSPGLANSVTAIVLLAAIGALAVATLRTRLTGPAVPLLTLAFVFGSHLWLYGFAVYVELFTVAVVAGFVYAFVRARHGTRISAALVAAAIGGWLVPEKPPLLVVVAAPLLLVAFRTKGATRRAAMAVAFVAGLAIGAAPYLDLSGGATWNAYAGDRFVNVNVPPFDATGGDEPIRVRTDQFFEPGFLEDTLSTGLRDRVVSTAYYVVGRHTGLLVFFPLALVVLALSVRYHRDPDTAVLLASIIAYVGFYVVLFPTNYYGGGAALGDRYFLQVSPLVLGLAAVAPISARQLNRGAGAALVAAVAFLGPHFADPQDALLRLDRTSPLQRLLPVETNQGGRSFFECGALDCTDRPPVDPTP